MPKFGGRQLFPDIERVQISDILSWEPTDVRPESQAMLLMNCEGWKVLDELLNIVKY